MVRMLQEIVKRRCEDVQAAKKTVAERDLRRVAARRTFRSLAGALRAGHGPRIIAEVKQRSPSAGVLRQHYDPAAIAAEYAQAGAVGISVLTEPHYFAGSGAHLQAVRDAVDLPVLCKDFVCDSYQLVEAAALGADVVLLIVAALDATFCRALHQEARDLGLEVIVEAHAERELDVALRCPDAIIGVNSRDLATLTTTLEVSRRLAAQVPADRLCIAESGLKTPADLRSLESVGYSGFLIGESLLRAAHPGDALRTLIAAGEPPAAAGGRRRRVR